jgi:hypothetical protein
MEEVTLAKHDHVVEQFSTKGAYPPFRAPILPWRSRRGAQLFDAEVSHSRVKGRSVDSVAVADQTDHVGVRADGLVAIVPARCVRRNVPHVADGGRPGVPDRFGMYFATVSLLTS